MTRLPGTLTAFEEVGGFDTSIPYYPTDCDMYKHLNITGYHHSPKIRYFLDVYGAIDVGEFYNAGKPGFRVVNG
jgi:hypothetical protein